MDFAIPEGIILFILGAISLGTGIIAFRRYSMTRSERLFTVGMAMTIAAVGIVAGAIDKLPSLQFLHLDYAWYTGTSVGYFLLFLSSIMNSVEQFRLLKRSSIIAGAVVAAVIGLASVFPDINDKDPHVIIPLNALRIVICSLGFFRYLMLYISKGTRFSLLLCLSFLFLAIGYAIIIPQVLDPISWQLPLVDGIIRMVGDALLFAAFVLG